MTSRALQATRLVDHPRDVLVWAGADAPDIAAGLPLDEPQSVAPRPSAPEEDEARPRQKERSPIVPALNKPLPQE